MNAAVPMEVAREALPAVSETAAIVQMIERAASNPAVDIDKMERLLMMQERVHARNAKAAFDDALAAMQPELPEIDERGGIKNSAGKVQSTYALWEDINAAIKPILAKHRFGLTFRVTNDATGIEVTGVLSGHGHREETAIKLPADNSGSKNTVQAVGSSTSYGQRYTAKLLLNLTSRGADDDGEAGGAKGGFVTDDDVADLQALMEDVGADRGRFLNYLKVGSLSQLPAAKLAGAIKMLEAKRQKGGAA